MTEQQIQKKIITYLEKEYNAYVVKVVSASKAGVPDILACIQGRFIGIEVKKPETKNNVSALQKHNLRTITNKGGLAIVAWDVDMIKELLDETFYPSDTESE